MYAVETTDSIATITPEQWDPLTGDNILASHGWLRTIELCHRDELTPRYTLVLEDERLVAASVCYGFRRSAESVGLDELMYGRLARFAGGAGLSFLPAMQLGAPGAYGGHVLVDPGLEPACWPMVHDRALDTLESIAAEQRMSVFCSNLLGDDRDLIERLLARGYNHTRLLPVCYLDIEWDSFEGYVGHLARGSRNMAAGVRKELRRGRRHGVTIARIEDADAHEETLQRLADTHWRRYNRVGFPYKPGFFGVVRRLLGEEAVIYGAFRDSQLFGFMLLLHRCGVAFALELGIDRAVAGNSATYFNLCFYEPIREAIAGGVGRIYYGRGVPQAKLRRGCKTQESFLCHRSRSRLAGIAAKPWFALHSRWNRKKGVVATPPLVGVGEGR